MTVSALRCSGTTAGFTTGAPWLPVPPTASAVNVKAEEREPDSMLAGYRALIHLKKTTPAQERGANTMLDTKNTQVPSWNRHAPGAPVVLVSLNFTAEPQTVNLAGVGVGAKQKLQTVLKSPRGSDPSGPNHIELAPFGVYVGPITANARCERKADNR